MSDGRLAQQLHRSVMQGPHGSIFLTGPLQICWRWALSLWLGFSFSTAETVVTLVIDPETCSLGFFRGCINSPFL